MKKRLIYWLTPYVTPEQHEKAALLSGRYFIVRFFKDVPSMLLEFASQRAAVLMIGDAGPRDEVKAIMTKLAATPETYGVRFVLGFSDSQSEAIKIAFAFGYRDMLPFDLDAAQWLRRFSFSTSGTPTAMHAPAPMMTMNAISAVSVPARVVWLSPSKLRLETKVLPQVGTKLHLSGPIAHYLGLNTVTLTVEEHVKHNLRFRFAEAMVCRWTTPEQVLPKKNLLIEHLRKVDTGAACRVFCILHSGDIRTDLMETLRPPRFEIATALNKKSIVEEPKYFSPHIVFIEDRLCDDEHFPYLQEVAKIIGEEVPIVIIGTNTNYERLRTMGRKIIPLPQIRPTLPRMIFEKYLPKFAARTSYGEPNDAFLVNVASDFSMAEIRVAARLRQLHPHAVQIALATKLGNFGLCRIDAPFLGKWVGHGVYAKITDSYLDTRMQTDGFPNLIDCTLINVKADERTAMAAGILDIMHRQLVKGKTEAEAIASATTLPHLETSSVLVGHTPEINAARAALARSSTSTVGGTSRGTAGRDDASTDGEEEESSWIPQIDWKQLAKTLRPVMLFLLVTGVIFGALGYITFRVAPFYERSGSEISEQFIRFQSKMKKERGSRGGPGESSP